MMKDHVRTQYQPETAEDMEAGCCLDPDEQVASPPRHGSYQELWQSPREETTLQHQATAEQVSDSEVEVDDSEEDDGSLCKGNKKDVEVFNVYRASERLEETLTGDR